MSTMTFGQKKFVPTAPEKGSFPLDHDGACKKSMLEYMLCLRETRSSSAECRELAKRYLSCRMERGLMAREDWGKLGFSEPDRVRSDSASPPAREK